MKNGFTYYYVELSPTEQIGVHSQQSWELSAVLIGRGERLIGDNREPFFSGDLVLLPPGMPHCWYFNPDTIDYKGHITNVSLMFMSETVMKLAEAFPLLKAQYDHLLLQKEARVFDRTDSTSLIQKLTDMRFLSDEEKIPAVISILTILSKMIDRTRIIENRSNKELSNQRLKQMEIFVACNYARRIGVEDMAKHMGMNKSAFCAFFKRSTGKTFMTYLNEYRLERVLYLLNTNPNTNISQIAYACGFQTISHFNHLFQARYHSNPRKMKLQKSADMM